MIEKAKYVPEGYKLMWGDDFDGESLDMRKWEFTEGMSGYEDLVISTEPEVVCVGDSKLKINAIKYTDKENPNIKYAATYSISTPRTMNFKYGYIEMKAKVPYKLGCWPSLWMKAVKRREENQEFLTYGKCKDYMAEVDIFEVFGTTNNPCANIHKWYYNATNETINVNYNALYQGKEYVFENEDNLSDEYHIYGFEWTPDKMSFSVDGEVYEAYDLTQNMDNDSHETDMSGFHDPMYILFNNHLRTPKSEFLYRQVDDKELPMSYYIDWICLYQKPGQGEFYTPTY